MFTKIVVIRWNKEKVSLSMHEKNFLNYSLSFDLRSRAYDPQPPVTTSLLLYLVFQEGEVLRASATKS